MKKEIKHSWFYHFPPEEVWEYLTSSELLVQWLMKNDMKPVVGHQFQFRTGPMPSFDFDGIVYCEITEIVPCKKLVYTWKGGPGKGQITLDTLVEWTLDAKDGGTLLQLVHSGFTESNANIFAAMDKGWLKNIGEVEQLLKGEKNGKTTA